MGNTRTYGVELVVSCRSQYHKSAVTRIAERYGLPTSSWRERVVRCYQTLLCKSVLHKNSTCTLLTNTNTNARAPPSIRQGTVTRHTLHAYYLGVWVRIKARGPMRGNVTSSIQLQKKIPHVHGVGGRPEFSNLSRWSSFFVFCGFPRSLCTELLCIQFHHAV